MADIEIFDASENEISTEAKNEVYDINGNAITVENAQKSIMADTDLIQRAIDGDKSAFNELYMQSYQYVFFVVRHYISDDETAYDAIQEIFIKVYKNIRTLRSPDAFVGWLSSVAKNTAIDIVRTARYTEISFDENEDLSPQKEENREVSLDVEKVLKELDATDAELLSLVYYDGMRVSQIAKMQGVPATTVYSRLKKAKKNLKAQLNAHGIDKAIYSGNFISMITVAIRNIIGTSLLSFAIAQQILDGIINGRGKKEIAVAKIIRKHQKKAILKIASVIVALSMITSAITVFLLTDWRNFKNSENKNISSYETSAEYSDSSEQVFPDNEFSDTDNSQDNDINNSGNSSDGYSDSTGTEDLNNNTSTTTSDAFIDDNVNKPVTDDEPPQPPEQDNETVNTIGNNPNNVMRTIAVGTEFGGLVAKQGDWLYYVQSATRLLKMKTDGSNRQILYEASAVTGINSLNVIGDTIYYISGGIWSMKNDGTNRKQLHSQTAYNLLVRGTTGWFVVPDRTSETPAKYVNYSLYQIDLLTGKTTTIVESGKGYGLKTVIDNSLIYVNGNNVYKRDLSTQNEIVIKHFDFNHGISNMLVKEKTIYFCSGNIDKRIVKIDINEPDAIKATYEIGNTYNYFDFGGGVVYGSIDNRVPAFYTLQGELLFDDHENIRYDVGIYTFDDGYAYYYDTDLSELYRCMPDGTEYNMY